MSPSLLRLTVVLLLTLASPAGPAAADTTVTLQVYVREGCPHCEEAEAYLARLAATRPGLNVVYSMVDRDPVARAELEHWTRVAGHWPPGVPTFVAKGHVMIGFADAETSGSALVALLEGRPVSVIGGVQAVQTSLFGDISVERLGFPLFTLVLGLLDGFNACAMWVLLVLLALLIRLQDRRRMLLIAGTFVLVSGAVYYAFMAAWLNVFLLVGLSDALRWGLAIIAALVGTVSVKDFFVFGRGVTLSIPESAKPGLYARMRSIVRAEVLTASLAAVIALAVVVNFVELLCTAGLPAIYTAMLAQQGLSTAAHYAYLGLYIAGYMADDTVMVSIAVIGLGSGRLTERGGRWLKLVSGVVMLLLAGVLALKPAWLM
jgi:hypothetical protein